MQRSFVVICIDHDHCAFPDMGQFDHLRIESLVASIMPKAKRSSTSTDKYSQPIGPI